MNNYRILDYAAAGVMIALLVAVRFFEEIIFYDPLNDYFHGDFQALPLPVMDLTLLMFSNSLRYLINGVLSIGILWMLFKSAAYIKAGLWVYLFAFLLLNVLFLMVLQWETDLSKMILFYTRRFILHPILLFVLIAGGYFLHTKKTMPTITKDSNEPGDIR